MRWEERRFSDNTGDPWLVADDQLGDWSIDRDLRDPDLFVLMWYPPFLKAVDATVGKYRSQAAAKRAAKRYAKRLAAACKAFARMGWT